jgi:hypothetical protein
MLHALIGIKRRLVVIAGACLFAIADIAAAADETVPKPLAEFPLRRVWMIVAIIVLMAFLFWILFYWQKRIEKAGYFGRIYQDTIKSIETTRLSGPIQRDWERGVYLDEVFLERSLRGKEWVEKNQRPKPADELLTLAAKLDLKYELRDIEQSMQRGRFGTGLSDGVGLNPIGSGGMTPRRSGRSGSVTGGLFGSVKPADHGPGDAAAGQAEEELRFWHLFGQFSKDAEAWVNRAAACAWAWYQEDLKSITETAQEQARQALSVDFSALQGRGPEFVLEFTAVVVIIFAAVILGLVERLSSEQIGTLLAAIAGYVLGKGATRSRPASGGDQAPAPLSPGGGSIETSRPEADKQRGALRGANASAKKGNG